MTIHMGDFKSKILYNITASNTTGNTIKLANMAPNIEQLARSFLYQIWDKCSVWNILFALLVVTNLKCIPFIWHFRILNGISRTIKAQRTNSPPSYKQIFQPLITTSSVPLMEIDFQMHKTNSSYFADIDVARSHLLSTLFTKGIEHYRGGTGPFASLDRPIFSCALGSVSCSFKRELKPYESYELWTRVLSWDEKWIYLVTHFVRAGAVNPKEFSLYPEQNPNAKVLTEAEGEKVAEQQASSDVLTCHPSVVATALSKCVFKYGRRTVAPALMMENSGLLPSTCEDKKAVSESSLQDKSCKSTESGNDTNQEEIEVLSSWVEKERVRGLASSRILATDALHALDLEFTGDDGPALGRHIDGTGFEGLTRSVYLLACCMARDGVSRLSSLRRKTRT